jgi:DNA-directed RNA polymerase subunit RPC12/RpoP
VSAIQSGDGFFAGLLKSEGFADENGVFTHKSEYLHTIFIEEGKMYEVSMQVAEDGGEGLGKVSAEYLERELFVCPICKKEHALVSKGNYLTCTACGLKVEYTEDLKLKSDNKAFTFAKLVDWYKFQLDYIKNYELKEGEEVIYQDEPIVAIDKTTAVRKVLARGKLTLTKTSLTIGDLNVLVNDITSLSVIGGTKLAVNIGDKSIMLKGHARFNPLKYILIFNILKPDLKEKYYTLDV